MLCYLCFYKAVSTLVLILDGNTLKGNGIVDTVDGLNKRLKQIKFPIDLHMYALLSELRSDIFQTVIHSN